MNKWKDLLNKWANLKKNLKHHTTVVSITIILGPKTNGNLKEDILLFYYQRFNGETGRHEYHFPVSRR